MFRVIEPVEISFPVAESPMQVHSKIVKHLTAKGGKIKVNDEATIVAGFGSGLKVRLLGAMFAGVKSMPRDVVVQLSKSSDGVHVSIAVRDTFGFGTRMGLADKLQILMYEDANSLKKSLVSAT